MKLQQHKALQLSEITGYPECCQRNSFTISLCLLLLDSQNPLVYTNLSLDAKFTVESCLNNCDNWQVSSNAHTSLMKSDHGHSHLSHSSIYLNIQFTKMLAKKPLSPKLWFKSGVKKIMIKPTNQSIFLYLINNCLD